jgi:hypothetical protein
MERFEGEEGIEPLLRHLRAVTEILRSASAAHALLSSRSAYDCVTILSGYGPSAPTAGPLPGSTLWVRVREQGGPNFQTIAL